MPQSAFRYNFVSHVIVAARSRHHRSTAIYRRSHRSDSPIELR